MTVRVLVTGANGFIGRHLCARLAYGGYRVRAALRTASLKPPGAAEAIVIGDIGGRTDWSAALQDVEHVVHAAARVHRSKETLSDVALYSETNALGTRTLATASAAARVARFVLLSTVKVNGEETRGSAFKSSDVPRPHDDYARSKWQAEQFVEQICTSATMQYAIVRAPLVYGVGVGANFLRLMHWIERGYLLPFGSLRNRRSLVSVWNLADLVDQVLRQTETVNHVWMAADGEDLSTPELARRIAVPMGRRARLIDVPERLLRFGGLLAGRSADISRLCSSLCVDSLETRSLLGWTPPLGVDAGLAMTVDWFRSGR